MKMNHHTIFILQNKLLKNINLLLLSDSENYYYVLIKNFNRFMANKTEIMIKNIFANFV